MPPSRLSLACATLVAAATAAPAQYHNALTGRTWNNPVSSGIDTILHGQQQMAMTRAAMHSAMVRQVIMQNEVLRRAGAARIAAGQATTNFTPSDKPSPSRKAVDEFEAALSARGLNRHDSADANALALVMAYQALRGEDPGRERLAGVREQYRRALLADEHFQAWTDARRQEGYEKRAAAAVSALAARAERPADAEREATGLLGELWSTPADGIILVPGGFADRGEELIKSGKATTAFTRGPRPVGVRPYMARSVFRHADRDELHFVGLLHQFDRHSSRLGGFADDLADGRAAAAAVLLQIVHGPDGRPTREQFARLREAMAALLKGSADQQRLLDAGRQAGYELSALSAMDLLAEDEYLARDAAATQARIDAARRSADGGGYTVYGDGSHLDYVTKCRADKRTAAASELAGLFHVKDFAAVPAEFREATGDRVPALAVDWLALRAHANPAAGHLREGGTTHFRRGPQRLDAAGVKAWRGWSASTPGDEQITSQLARFRAEVEKRGVKSDDVADCRAAAVAWLRELSGAAPLTADQFTRVRAYSTAEIQATDVFRTMPDAERQLDCERLALNTTDTAADVASAEARAREREALPPSNDYLARLMLDSARNTRQSSRASAAKALHQLVAPLEPDQFEALLSEPRP